MSNRCRIQQNVIYPADFCVRNDNKKVVNFVRKNEITECKQVFGAAIQAFLCHFYLWFFVHVRNHVLRCHSFKTVYCCVLSSFSIRHKD